MNVKFTPLARRRVTTPALVASGLLALALLASACGSATATESASVASLPPETAARGSDGASTPTAAPSPGGDGQVSDEQAEKAQLDYDACMKEQGIDVEELFGDGGQGEVIDGGLIVPGSEEETNGPFVAEGDFEDFEAASIECEPILEAVFGEFTLSPEQEAAQADIELKFNQCMSEKGFAIGDEGEIELGEDVDPDEIDAAFDDCDEVFEEFDELFSAGGDNS